MLVKHSSDNLIILHNIFVSIIFFIVLYRVIIVLGFLFFFFFKEEEGIRYLVGSGGLVVVYKRRRQSRSSTLTVTITAVSRPNLGACLLLFTEIKPSKLLDLILLSNFWGTEHFRCSFCFRSSQLHKSLSAIYLQFALGGLFYPELCIPAQNRMAHHG